MSRKGNFVSNLWKSLTLRPCSWKYFNLGTLHWGEEALKFFQNLAVGKVINAYVVGYHADDRVPMVELTVQVDDKVCFSKLLTRVFLTSYTYLIVLRCFESIRSWWRPVSRRRLIHQRCSEWRKLERSQEQSDPRTSRSRPRCRSIKEQAKCSHLELRLLSLSHDLRSLQNDLIADITTILYSSAFNYPTFCNWAAQLLSFIVFFFQT